MEKFPVISETGNEYLVKVNVSKWFHCDVYDIKLYKKKKFFNIHYDSFLDEKTYYETAYFKDKSIITMVKNLIYDYEEKLNYKYISRNKLIEFEQWDGIIKFYRK